MRLFCFGIVMILTMTACQSNTQNNETPTSSDEIEIIQEEGLLSSTLQTILLSSDEVVRNLDFSMNKAQIEKIEQSEMVESTDEGTLYSINLSDTDFADITYTYDDNENLTKVQIDIFTENEESTTAYLNEMENHFDEKYMKVDNLWDGVDYTIFLKEFTNNDNGLYAVWEKN